MGLGYKRKGYEVVRFLVWGIFFSEIKDIL